MPRDWQKKLPRMQGMLLSHLSESVSASMMMTKKMTVVAIVNLNAMVNAVEGVPAKEKMNVTMVTAASRIVTTETI